ncbi:uncharacterized protein VTP21DRAFT_10970 [Calcarisporiella thermophila]|uniref:uncharacterized protein n=1 Tax=Calcarisporiella thermophila TaxID=911321 RepID=UPI003743FA85
MSEAGQVFDMRSAHGLTILFDYIAPSFSSLCYAPLSALSKLSCGLVPLWPPSRPLSKLPTPHRYPMDQNDRTHAFHPIRIRPSKDTWLLKARLNF